MYAIFETGGKQYRVEQGDVIDVELFPRKKKTVEFDRVLLVGGDKGIKMGSPVVDGAKVSGVIVEEHRAPKVLVFKKKRRKGYKRLRGHRQDLLRVMIKKITA